MAVLIHTLFTCDICGQEKDMIGARTDKLPLDWEELKGIWGQAGVRYEALVCPDCIMKLLGK